MKPIDILLCVLCVVGVSVGQLMLRATAIRINSPELSLLEKVLSWQAVLAVALYGAMLVLWMYILTRVPLSFAFPFYALSFLLVPLFAWAGLGDPAPWQTWAGGVLIMIGVILSSSGSGA
ncbi:MAG: EamA family transporter [Burkholderiales bacterium]|nr:EamA family transporter [Burkholderiales bacterium]MCL4688184.1 EamA family transporter [Burkholderiales bacterium]